MQTASREAHSRAQGESFRDKSPGGSKPGKPRVLSGTAYAAPTHLSSLHVFTRATHARTPLPAALASVPFGFVLV